MKKSLLLSAVAIAALTANAEVINYDFNTNPPFFTALYEEIGWQGEYDLVDKYGMDVNTSGTMFCDKDEEGNWHAVPNYCIDLVDGQTYNLVADDMDEIDYSHPFLSWDQDGVGPSRVHYFNGWNSTEEYEDKDYGAASEADFIASKGALGFLRQGNNAARQGTYVQFPAVANPTKVTIWMCNQGGSYHEKGLYSEITPVINGEALEAIPVEGPSDYLPKRYYKVETELSNELANNGSVVLRVGCGGSQVQLIHVAIEAGGADGIESIYDEAAKADAPVYNMFGVKVDSSYKGVVIKNGKKFVQK